MKSFILFVLLIVSIKSKAQELTKDNIEGSWTVEKVVIKSQNPDYAPITNGFVKSTFIFNDSGVFQLKNESSSTIFSNVIRAFENASWLFDNENQIIKVGNEDDNFSRLIIFVKNIEGKVFFHLKESRLKFQMNKV